MDVARVKHVVKRTWLEGVGVRRTVSAVAYDARRYLALSSTRSPYVSRENLAAKLIAHYHSIEKGLALPAPRPGFGKTVIPVVVRLVNVYVERYGEDEVTRSACGALRAYLAFNEEQGLTPAEIPVHESIVSLLDACEAHPVGVSGTTKVKRDDVLAAVDHVGLEFFTSRRSTRVFSTEPVTDAELEFAVRAAMSAPAVCNREFGQVTVWRDPVRIGEVLSVQGGANGFGDGIPALAMVTVSQRAYWAEAERNQGWIDGGLFAMAFMHGLHAQGLGSVALNWSKSPATDRRMRQLVGLDEARSIVMFIGFGHLREEYRVAASPRRPLEEFLQQGD